MSVSIARITTSFAVAALLASSASAMFQAGPVDEGSYFKASNTGAGDGFAFCVSMSGDTIVIAAPLEDGAGTGTGTGIGAPDEANNAASNAGAAYVFVRSGGVWIQEDYIKASNTDGDDRFGISIACDGDRMVVGAPFEDSSSIGVNGIETNNSASSSGAAYVFERSGGVWTQTAYLKAFNTGSGDRFGQSVAVEGDTIVVGASAEASNSTDVMNVGDAVGPEHNNDAAGAGAAYVFRITAGTWAQEAYLKATNTGAGDEFGLNVAIDDDTAVVGARFEASNATGIDGDGTDNSAAIAGAAYIFTRSGSTWSQGPYLKGANTQAGDVFGASVAVDGNTILVGASSEHGGGVGVDPDPLDNSEPGAGAAYVFTKSGGIWTQQAYLKASNSGASDSFGVGVTLEGNVAVVSAFHERSSATGVGGDQLDDSVVQEGAAYVFVRSGTSWGQKEYLKSTTPDAGDAFGRSVALSGNTLIVGERQEDSNQTGVDGPATGNNSMVNAGAAHSFDLELSAQVTYRNAGANPVSYTANAPMLGGTWTGSVDLTTTGHSFGVVMGYLWQTLIVLPGLQGLLVNPGSPGGELLGFAPLPGPTATFSVAIPMDASLCGFELKTQAVHVGGVLPFALSNARDLRIGF